MDDVIVGGIAQAAVKPAERLLHGRGERRDLGVGEVAEGRLVPLGHQPALERTPRRERGERHELLVLPHHPDSRHGLLAKDVAVDAAALPRKERLGALEFLRRPLWDDRKRDELGMRMREGGAGRPAVVAEQQQILEALIPIQVAVPLPVHPHRRRHLPRGQRGRVEGVARSFDDDFMGADAAHRLEESIVRRRRRPLDAQGGVLVGDDAHFPARRVGQAAGTPDGRDLRRRPGLLALAERAGGGVIRQWIPRRKVRRPGRPLGGDDHPPAGDGILSQFRHRTTPFPPAGGNLCFACSYVHVLAGS